MTMVNRRTFLGGCIALGGLQVFGTAQAKPVKQHALIHVFLRGGLDSLSLICPRKGDVRTAYDNLRRTNPNDILPLYGDWGMYAGVNMIKDLWDSKRVAVIHGCGLDNSQMSLSNTQAMRLVKRGLEINPCNGEIDTAGTGWIARYLREVANTDKALSIGHGIDEALYGLENVMSYSGSMKGSGFHNKRSNFSSTFNNLLSDIYQGDAMLDRYMQSAIHLVKNLDKKTITQPENDKQKFEILSELIRIEELNIRAATIELDGWNSHTFSQKASLLNNLDKCIGQFDKQMRDAKHPYTMIIQSEMGRANHERLGSRTIDGKKHTYHGTEHGAGTVMLVIGDKINGKKIYGTLPTAKVLIEDSYIPVSTDYRTVIREVLGKRFGANTGQLEKIFPEFSDTSELGILKGSIATGKSTTPPLDCQESGTVFASSFETND